MKKNVRNLTWLLLFTWGIVYTISCHKSKLIDASSLPSKNKQPVSVAGPDISITLPEDSVFLDGRASYDPDGTIISYKWEKISGPASSIIENPAGALTKVKNLGKGSYYFRLTVIDNKNDSSESKKHIEVNDAPLPAITISFTEEFDSVFKLESKGWVIKDNSNTYARWVQGSMGHDKGGIPYGFPAYSFSNTQDEFIYASVATSGYYGNPISTYYSVSSWLITPVLSVKNGDKISFYTRGDEGPTYADRLQVRMNGSAGTDIGFDPGSLGEFITLLTDINSAQAQNGYPKIWTKFEYTFSGINGTINTRIAFRYFVPSSSLSKGIGIDLFRFQRF